MGGIAFVAAVFVGYALISRRLRTTAITGAIFFAALGLLASDRVLGIITIPADGEAVRFVLEVTLAVVLFHDASATGSTALLRERSLPLRLLVIGLPLSILVGWGLALVLLPGLALWEAAVAAAILAPTDAALGEAVISDPRVPAFVRDGLSVESGLNDGLALPFITIFLALTLAANGQESAVQPLETFLRAIVLSAGVGIGVAWLAAVLLLRAQDRGWSEPRWQSLALLGIVVLAYVGADALQGSGFIATWTAGAAFGTVQRGRLPGIGEFPEKIADLLTSVSFLLFGALFLGPAVEHATWAQVGYAVLSLTVVRMLPVALSLFGTRLSRPTVLYVGWFGPRGLASLIFAGLVVENELPGASPIVNVVMLTVGLSIVLHGVSAWWGAERYADWFERAKRAHPDLPEAGASPPVARRRGIAGRERPSAD